MLRLRVGNGTIKEFIELFSGHVGSSTLGIEQSVGESDRFFTQTLLILTLSVMTDVDVVARCSKRKEY